MSDGNTQREPKMHNSSRFLKKHCNENSQLLIFYLFIFFGGTEV
jgi:hypothetical protein